MNSGSAGLALFIATACNLTSPILTGILFEMLVNRASQSRYCWFLGCLATLYTVEPLMTRLYISNVVSAGERVRPHQSVLPTHIYYLSQFSH